MAKIVPIKKRADGKCTELCLECVYTPADYELRVGNTRIALCENCVKQLGVTVDNKELDELREKANDSIRALVNAVTMWESNHVGHRYCPYKWNNKDIPKDKGCLYDGDLDYDCRLCTSDYYSNYKRELFEKYKV